MRLKSLQIKKFKCIRDSSPFSIDPKVTCLVGKNESGKTAILQALVKLNSTDEALANFNEIDDFPRHELITYREQGADRAEKALVTEWELSPGDVADMVQVLGPSADGIKSISLTKSYANKIGYSLVDIDEGPIVEHLIASHDLEDVERLRLTSARTVADLRRCLEELRDPEPSEKQKALLAFIKSSFDSAEVKRTVFNRLIKRLPKIAYFSEYIRMPGQLSIQDLKKRQNANQENEGDKVFLALLEMINRSVQELEDIHQHEPLKAELEAASNRITRDIFRYWTQNRHLKVQFLFEQGMSGDPAPFNTGWILRTRIENTRHGASTIFNQRSAGFVWFFSFLVWFSQIRRRHGDNIIILLDEPGLSLHATAQADLLRYIEEQLAPMFQVIYTTHSPFMIDPGNLLRARTVEDVFLESREGEPEVADPDVGTKVGDNVLSTDRDTIFPLRACLGYEITQTLFIGEHSVLVEGPSEILYFTWFRRRLAELGRTALDLRWTITPCGGIDKIPAFLSLFAGGRLHIAVVTDLAVGQKKKVETLRRSKLLRDGHVLTMDTYADQPEADIEDIIGRANYVDLVRLAYNLPAERSLPTIRPSNAPIRVVKEVEEFFGTLPPEIDGFDHYRPAEFLIQLGPSFTLPELEPAMRRFEDLFRDLNAMLP